MEKKCRKTENIYATKVSVKNFDLSFLLLFNEKKSKRH